MACANKVEIPLDNEGKTYAVKCGSWQGGEMVFCDRCYANYKKEYPQGWLGYPGDTCKHGKYVGGSGIDWMCGACEME